MIDTEPLRDDPVLCEIVAEARADPTTIGIILSGSRGAGCAREDSDYDLGWVPCEDAWRARKEQGQSLHPKDARPGQPETDIWYTTLPELERLAAEPGWWTPGYVTARVLIDKTGDVSRVLQAMIALPAERTQADVAAWYDAYLNAFHRSLKAWRRGDELGGRLLASEAAM